MSRKERKDSLIQILQIATEIAGFIILLVPMVRKRKK